MLGREPFARTTAVLTRGGAERLRSAGVAAYAGDLAQLGQHDANVVEVVPRKPSAKPLRREDLNLDFASWKRFRVSWNVGVWLFRSISREGGSSVPGDFPLRLSNRPIITRRCPNAGRPLVDRSNFGATCAKKTP
jgi:hypothetical protein